MAAAALLCALVASLAVAVAPAAAAEESDTAPIRDYDGSMWSQIVGPESPEMYPLRVNLASRQELEQLSPTEVEVVYLDGTESFTVSAEKAHDAAGVTVPTTLEKTGNDVVTFTVHHRAGNPAAGGAPFDYPISAGEGWEGEAHTVIVQGPPDEAELRAMREREVAAQKVIEANPPAPTEPSPTIACKVPSLHGYSLRGAKNRLRGAHCGIGSVYFAAGATAAEGKVVKQFHPVGSELPAGAPVAVKLDTSASR